MLCTVGPSKLQANLDYYLSVSWGVQEIFKHFQAIPKKGVMIQCQVMPAYLGFTKAHLDHTLNLPRGQKQ